MKFESKWSQTTSNKIKKVNFVLFAANCPKAKYLIAWMTYVMRMSDIKWCDFKEFVKVQQRSHTGNFPNMPAFVNIETREWAIIKQYLQKESAHMNCSTKNETLIFYIAL